MTHNSLEGLKIKRQVLPILFVVGMVLLSGIGWCEALFFWGTQSDGSGGSLSKPAEEIEVDYYEVLELPSGSDSTESQIKKQFRVLSKKYHPDLNPTEEARQKYLVIQRAYEVLSDRRRRKVYDMKGEAGLKAFETQEKGGGNDHHPLSDFFGFFGGGNNNTPQRGADVNIQVVVPLRDMYSGNTHTVHFSKQKLCRKCKGTGAASKSDLHTCGECDGTGTVVQNIRLGPGMVQRMQSACRKCNGKGKIIKRVCPVCHGHKVSRGKTILDVAVERGVSENHKITIDMEADESPDVLPGDVLLHIVSAPDERFERQPNQVDLAMTLVLTLSESLLGFSKRVVHLDGHDFQVSREDRVTPHLHKIVIKGEGMPHHNIPSEFGDLHITFHVEYGKKRIDSETKTQLSELLRDL